MERYIGEGQMPSKARGRLISPNLSTSPAVNALSTEAALLYTWLIPHLDDQGRMMADPEYVRAVVVPMRRDIRQVRKVKRLLEEMEAQGLIILYWAVHRDRPYSPEEPVLQLVGWWEHQTLPSARPSVYPPPDGWLDRVGDPPPRDTRGRYR